MAFCRLLTGCVTFGAASLMIGTFALAQKHTAGGELGSCAAYSGLPSDDNDHAGMAFIRSGTFVMGSERQRPEERFTHVVRVDGFWIDRHEVTNAQFREFVTATGYVTLAERGLDPATHPGMPKELLTPGRWSSSRPPMSGAAAGSRNGGSMSPAPIGVSRPVPAARSRARTIIRSCISPTRMRLLMRAGAVVSSRPRRNGSSPRAAVATGRTIGRARSM